VLRIRDVLSLMRIPKLSKFFIPDPGGKKARIPDPGDIKRGMKN
jgi:hypothetical protein